MEECHTHTKEQRTRKMRIAHASHTHRTCISCLVCAAQTHTHTHTTLFQLRMISMYSSPVSRTSEEEEEEEEEDAEEASSLVCREAFTEESMHPPPAPQLELSEVVGMRAYFAPDDVIAAYHAIVPAVMVLTVHHRGAWARDQYMFYRSDIDDQLPGGRAKLIAQLQMPRASQREAGYMDALLKFAISHDKWTGSPCTFSVIKTRAQREIAIDGIFTVYSYDE